MVQNILLNFDNWLSNFQAYHCGTIIQKGITSKKIACYMRNSACRWFIVENAKIFRRYVKVFEFSHVKEIVESGLIYVKKFL